MPTAGWGCRTRRPARAFERAREQGAPERWLPAFEGGFAGVVATLDTGRPGPTTAFRVDMDALDLNEQHDDSHRPHRDHFASCNAGMMHACGHDGHTAIGLGLAHVLKQYAAQLNGVIKLIFQPAEEGTAAPARWWPPAWLMTWIISRRSISGPACRQVPSSAWRQLYGHHQIRRAVQRRGRPRRRQARGRTQRAAGRRPAALGLHAIPPHSAGASRVNVGVMQARYRAQRGSPSSALLKVETRGESEAINQYVFERAQHVVAGGGGDAPKPATNCA